MNILCKKVSHWGRTDVYPVEPIAIEALRLLTGRNTIREQDKKALLMLGHTISETEEKD